MNAILRGLDWLLGIVERLLVLSLACFIFYFGYQLVRGNSIPEQLAILKALSDNWKLGLIVLIVLFYGTVRVFLEQVQEVWGMKRPLPGVPDKPEPLPPKK